MAFAATIRAIPQFDLSGSPVTESVMLLITLPLTRLNESHAFHKRVGAMW